jgi:hypothetical protein
MNELYHTGAAVPGTIGGSSLGVFQAAFTLALTALPLLGCVPRVLSGDSAAQPLTLDARWSADPDRARHGFSQLPDNPR